MAGADLGCNGSPDMHDNLRDMCQLRGGDLLVTSARGSWQVPSDLLCPGHQNLGHAQVKGSDHGLWVPVSAEGTRESMGPLKRPDTYWRREGNAFPSYARPGSDTHTVHRIKEWFVLEGILRII